MTTEEIVNRDLGIMQGQNAILTVQGYGNAVNGNGKGGVTILDDDTFVLEDVSSWSGFSGVGITNAGTLEIAANNYTNTIGNSVVNNGALNITGEKTVTFQEDVTGSGNVTVSTTSEFEKLLDQTSLTIDSGIVSINASNLYLDNAVTNAGKLELAGGTLSVGVTGDNGVIELSDSLVLNADITGKLLDLKNKNLTIGSGTLTVSELSSEG